MTIVLAADDHEYDSVVRLWPCCKVTFETLPVALSTRAFQTKTSKLTLKSTKTKDEKHGICDTSAKTSPKKEQTTIKNKSPKHHLVHENHTKIEVF